MTNSEINQSEAIKAMESGKLTSYESDFVESIRNYSKKDLKNLSTKQYDLLRKCADKA
jgi:hypothetical protein